MSLPNKGHKMLTKDQLDDLALRCKKQWKIRYDEIEVLIAIARGGLSPTGGPDDQNHHSCCLRILCRRRDDRLMGEMGATRRIALRGFSHAVDRGAACQGWRAAGSHCPGAVLM